MSLGTLYIVATPIDNLEDITFRAIKILSDVDYILCEDTRVTHKLVTYLNDKWQLTNEKWKADSFKNDLMINIQNSKLISYHQHSDETKKLQILNYLLDGKNIALVTDAGTPGVSDPGNELIDFILSFQPDVKIIPIPGASAITTALSVCGFQTNRFVFLGFLPKKKLNKLFKWLKEGKNTFAFFESPSRIYKTVSILEKVFGKETRIFIARELTKLHETLYRGKLSDVGKDFTGRVKGEIVVVVEL